MWVMSDRAILRRLQMMQGPLPKKQDVETVFEGANGDNSRKGSSRARTRGCRPRVTEVPAARRVRQSSSGRDLRPFLTTKE
jgi:hypothetical protein